MTEILLKRTVKIASHPSINLKMLVERQCFLFGEMGVIQCRCAALSVAMLRDDGPA